MSNNMNICVLLFIIGFIEEFIGVIYYGFIRKGWKIPCSITSMLRNIVWIIVSAGIFSSFLDFNKSLIENFWMFVNRGIFHTLGVGIGDYCSLVFEPILDKVILRLSNKGRKKKRWYLQGDRKI